MRWNSKLKLRTSWDQWFAWRPIRTIDLQWVWLERVERTHYMNQEIDSDLYRPGIGGATYCYRVVNKR